MNELVVRLLKPLGNPPANSVKFYATLALLELVKGRAWLDKVTNALHQHWQKRKEAKQIYRAKLNLIQKIKRPSIR
jgi:hypothetical protein